MTNYNITQDPFVKFNSNHKHSYRIRRPMTEWSWPSKSEKIYRFQCGTCGGEAEISETDFWYVTPKITINYHNNEQPPYLGVSTAMWPWRKSDVSSPM